MIRYGYLPNDASRSNFTIIEANVNEESILCDRDLFEVACEIEAQQIVNRLNNPGRRGPRVPNA